MVKLTIKWTGEAIDQKKDILAYWFYCNKSLSFRSKLEKEIIAELKFIAQNPSIKKQLTIDTYYLRVREYWLLNSLIPNTLLVEAMLDARQDPNNLTNQP